MRWFSRLIFILLLLSPVALFAIAWACLETHPRVESEATMSPGGVARAKQLLQDHDPRKLQAGETKTVRMSQEELMLVMNHLLTRFGRGGGEVVLADGSLNFRASVDLAKVIPGRFLNIDSRVADSDGAAAFESLKIGRINFPRPLVNAVARFGALHFFRASGVDPESGLIRDVAITPQGLDVSYEWQPTIVDAVRDRLVSAEDRERLEDYNEALAQQVAAMGRGITYAKLLRAIFEHAAQRSKDGDAVAENRAAIVSLAAYISGSGLRALVPASVNWTKPRRRSLQIFGRRDFAQHFTTSAALAVAGGDAVSKAIGLYKEIDDADGGSGFSFRDLAADMAGTEFGNFAVANADTAALLQQRLSSEIVDASLMPSVDGLEENLSDGEFKQRYGGVGGKRYTAVVDAIERSIFELALYR